MMASGKVTAATMTPVPYCTSLFPCQHCLIIYNRDDAAMVGNALARPNAGIKDLLDPNGIFAPGKNGIRPRAYWTHA